MYGRNSSSRSPEDRASCRCQAENTDSTYKDTLQPNTTYSFNFGNAIRDVNEGNILKNFTYVFSTGKYIDSMRFSGTVLVANTGKADSTMIVLLHKETGRLGSR